MAQLNETLHGLFGLAFYLAQIATYIMALVRWFGTAHDTFWLGFKELIWALCPLVNFTYVWDWWWAAFMFVFAFLSWGVESVKGQ